jgi:hypothetical protein
MPVKYMKIEIDIHGIQCNNSVVTEYLTGVLKEATKSALKGDMKEYFNFRDEFDSDIEVDIVERAGEFYITNEDD